MGAAHASGRLDPRQGRPQCSACVDVIRRCSDLAPAASAPRRAATAASPPAAAAGPPANATTAAAAASTPVPATSAGTAVPATSAAATTSAAGCYLLKIADLRRSGVLLVEDIEGRQADVRDFLLAQCHDRNGRGCGTLWCIRCRRICRCAAGHRKRHPGGQNGQGGPPTLSVRSSLGMRHTKVLPYLRADARRIWTNATDAVSIFHAACLETSARSMHDRRPGLGPYPRLDQSPGTVPAPPHGLRSGKPRSRHRPARRWSRSLSAGVGTQSSSHVGYSNDFKRLLSSPERGESLAKRAGIPTTAIGPSPRPSRQRGRVSRARAHSLRTPAIGPDQPTKRSTKRSTKR